MSTGQAIGDRHLNSSTSAHRVKPTITVGLPVRNGARYLRTTLDAILSQRFRDFELVVADNASTDDTPQICEQYAKQDRRIRLIRHEENIGAARNHNLLVRLARGTYFKWAAHDDLIRPQFLERCVETLEAEPSAVVCFTGTRVIDGQGRDQGPLGVDMTGSDSDRVHIRLSAILRTDPWCVDLFGLFRLDALRSTSLIAGYIGADRTLRAELALLGPLHHIGEDLFLSRDHAGRSTRAMPAHHLRGAWFDPALEGIMVLPHWRIFAEYLRCVWRSALPQTERWRCLAATITWLGQHANGARMLADLFIATWPRSWKFFFRLARSHERWLPPCEGRWRRPTLETNL